MKPEAMTIAKRLKHEGYQEGIEIGTKQGIEQGIERGIELSQATFVIKSYKNGLNTSIIAEIVGIPEQKVKEILKN